MAWDDIARREHRRETGRYPGDLTDLEWAVIASLLPAPGPGGRPRTTFLRDVVEAILYIATTGCQLRQLPKDFPPVSTVQAISTRGAMRGCGRRSTTLLSSGRAFWSCAPPAPRPG
mgnify:CR=1 FL=1